MKEEKLFNQLYELFEKYDLKSQQIIKYDETNKPNKNTLYLFPTFLSGEDKNIYVKSFILAKKLRKAGYSTQLYYDIFILGISSINDRPKCIICGKPAKFDTENGFVRGYLKSCNDSSHRKLAMRYILQLKENREKQKQSHKGWVPSNELRNKWSVERKGKKKNFKKEFIEYLIQRNKDFDWTQERRDLISNKIINRLKVSPNSRKSFKKGWYGSKFTGKTYHFDSSWEEKMIIYLEKILLKGYIKHFDRCTEYVKYKTDDGFFHKYIPDFYVVLNDGTKVIIEIKPASLLKKSRVVYLKKMAGLKYFKKKNYKYIILTENELFKNIKGSFNIFDYIV